MKFFILFPLIFLSSLKLAFGQQEAKTMAGKTVLLYNDGSWVYADSVPLWNIKVLTIDKLEIPKTDSRDNIISHTGYSLLYNEKYEQSNWVAYDLTKKETDKLFSGQVKRVFSPTLCSNSHNVENF